MPVASIAAPETSNRIRGPSDAGSPSITSRTSTSKDEIVVPWKTEYPVHCMPGCTSVSGHDRVTGGGGRRGEEAGRDGGGGEKAESHGGARLVRGKREGKPSLHFWPGIRSERCDLSTGHEAPPARRDTCRPSSRSYARTHLRTALSDTPYLRPTGAAELVAATSASSCS